MPQNWNLLASSREEENSRHVKTCCSLSCWGKLLLPGREGRGVKKTRKGRFHQMKPSRDISRGRLQEMSYEQGQKIILEGTRHKFKLLWINESRGTGQKGNLRTHAVLDQCLELPLTFHRRPFTHQSYKRSITAIHPHVHPHVHTDTHTHHLFLMSAGHLPSLPTSLQHTSARIECQDGARVDITTWKFVWSPLLGLHWIHFFPHSGLIKLKNFKEPAQ